MSTPQKDFAFDVVVVGSANLDLVATLDHLPKPGETIVARDYAEHAGGKGVNQAVACARMGARTAFVGCVGNDDAGAFLRGVLENEGIDTTMLRVVDMPTGRAFINVDSRGENEIVVVSGANFACVVDATRDTTGDCCRCSRCCSKERNFDCVESGTV